MDWERSYFDLCKEIEILEIRLDNLFDEMKFMNRQLNSGPRTKLVASYSGMPGCGGDATPLDRQWVALQRLQGVIDGVRDILSLKIEAKNRMEAKMNEFESLENKVVFMRDIRGLPLFKIAEELDYTYDWIRKISARVKHVKLA